MCFFPVADQEPRGVTPSMFRCKKRSKNSYYYFVVTFSADNMNFTSMIDYTQNTVNTSEYSHPHKFKYNTETYLKFPACPTNPTEYVAVCKAPDYLTPDELEDPGAESIHIVSWGSRSFWEPVFIFLLLFSILGLLIISAVFLIVWCYLKDRHFCSHLRVKCAQMFHSRICSCCRREGTADERARLINS